MPNQKNNSILIMSFLTLNVSPSATSVEKGYCKTFNQKKTYTELSDGISMKVSSEYFHIILATEIDEDSLEYSNSLGKLSLIAEKTQRSKSANSIKESLGL